MVHNQSACEDPKGRRAWIAGSCRWARLSADHARHHPALIVAISNVAGVGINIRAVGVLSPLLERRSAFGINQLNIDVDVFTRSQDQVDILSRGQFAEPRDHDLHTLEGSHISFVGRCSLDLFSTDIGQKKFRRVGGAGTRPDRGGDIVRQTGFGLKEDGRLWGVLRPRRRSDEGQDSCENEKVTHTKLHKQSQIIAHDTKVDSLMTSGPVGVFQGERKNPGPELSEGTKSPGEPVFLVPSPSPGWTWP